MVYHRTPLLFRAPISSTDNRISPPEVVARGVEIICSPGSRDNPHTQSRLCEILEEAAAGSRLNDLSAFSMCFNKLL